MSDETVTRALENLSAIKSGDDPRTHVDADTNEQTMVEKVQSEVDRVFEEHDMKGMSRHDIHCYVADWQGKLGNCKYNTVIESDRYGKRLPSSAIEYGRSGQHSVGVAIRRMESDAEKWKDTVRHEVAHALTRHMHGADQGHNENWKAIAERIGADPTRTSSHDNTDYNYFVGCSSGCTKIGRQRRSKMVKHPYRYRCRECGENVSSWESGDERPGEPGTCAVDW